jgi:hypothetical protein
MLILCSHCKGKDDKCAVCKGNRVALVFSEKVIFWQRNLTPIAARFRKIWRLTKQIIEGVVLLYIIFAIIAILFLTLNNSNFLSDKFVLSRAGIILLLAILYFYYQIYFRGRSSRKIQEHFEKGIFLPEEESEVWQKDSALLKINCANYFDWPALDLIDNAVLLADSRKQKLSLIHILYVLIFQTEIKHYFIRAEVDLYVFKNRLKNSIDSGAKTNSFHIGKEIIELFLLAYINASSNGKQFVGIDEILIAFSQQGNYIKDILSSLNLEEDDFYNLAYWSLAQNEASRKVRKVRKNEKRKKDINFELLDNNKIFRNIISEIPLLENENRIFFSYWSILGAIKIQKELFSKEKSFDKIFSILDFTAKTVRNNRGEGAVINVEDIKNNAEIKL